MVGYITDYFFWEQVGLQVKRLDASPVSACPATSAAAKRIPC